LRQSQVEQRRLIETFPAAPGVERDVAVVRSGFHLASGDPSPGTPPPQLGADTAALLEQLGYDDAAVARLRATGAV
jgi:crotonobetainyl-CoA:carnitine CoA-transferase CaiB-like acyl-CoA transferase